VVELILFGLGIAAGFGVMVFGLSAALAWLASRLFPNGTDQLLALVTAGAIPVGLLIWSLFSFVGSDCCESGPEAQGLLLLMVMHGVLLMLVWPLSYRFNLSMIESARV
jgi:hypothetical protein